MPKQRLLDKYQLHKDWLDCCLDQSEKLTTWEIELCESLNQQIDKHKGLTEAQADRLEEIYANKTS